MTVCEGLILGAAGLLSGILAGFLGIGGGTVLVPLLLAMGGVPVEAVATSNLAIAITALSGTLQNWRMGVLSLRRILGLGLPSVATAQLGADLAERIPSVYLLTGFGLLLWLNIYLVSLRQQLEQQKGDYRMGKPITRKLTWPPLMARLMTGGIAGLLAGLLGVGGGVIMVPLQILLLQESIKTAIQTSLGVIVITAISACAGHALRGNVLWFVGLILGLGGLLGAQISTHFLPKLPDRILGWLFRSFLALLSIYVFFQAWQIYYDAT
jgi:hypothetical protein